MQVREDISIIKGLYENGYKTLLQDWITSPTIDLPDGWDKERRDIPLNYQEALKHTFFNLFKIKIPTHRNGKAIGTTFNLFKKVTKNTIKNNLGMNVSLDVLEDLDKNTQDFEDPWVVYLYVKDTDFNTTFCLGNVIIDAKLGQYVTIFNTDYGEKVTAAFVNQYFGFSIWLNQLITLEPKHPVSVKTQLTDKQLKKEKILYKTKPWLCRYEHKIIWLDPELQLHRTQTTPIGTHASPIPHTRRGHWKILRHEKWGANKGKAIFVRSSWVGPTEWTSEGKVYKVIQGEQHEKSC